VRTWAAITSARSEGRWATGYGDEIIAAGQAQRAFEQSKLPSRINGLNWIPRWHPIWEGNPAIARPDYTGMANDILNGPHCRPYIVYPFTADTGWTFNRTFHARDHVAKIYLTDDERQRAEWVCRTFGPYVLIEPWSKHMNLRWPLDHWQALIDSRPDLTFVQHTHADSPELRRTERVLATFREACALVERSALYIRGESGMCHAAAALGIPQVTIWGACMDWTVLGGYDKQLGLGVSDSPCGCYKPCAHCALAMAAISVEAVSHAIDVQLACYLSSA